MLPRVAFVSDEQWQDHAVAAILAMADQGPDDGTLDFVAASLGDFARPAGLPLLLQLSRHEDEEIRLSAVTGIPACCGPHYRGIPAAVDALIERMADEDDDVRDWATFGVGAQLEDDSTAIRDALAGRLQDTCEEVRHEAIAGLARRRDPHAIAPTLAKLRGQRVLRTIVEAAEYLAADVLLAALQTLATAASKVATTSAWRSPPAIRWPARTRSSTWAGFSHLSVVPVSMLCSPSASTARIAC